MPTSSTTDPRHAAARRHLQDGAPQAALPILEALLEDTPDDPDLLNDAALAHAQDGNTARAERCLRRALEVQPEHETAFYNLLDLLIEARKDVDAREVFASHADQLPESDDKTRYRKQLGGPLPAHQGDGAPARSRDTDTLRIAFVCGPDRKFITDIEREIGKRHEVRTAYFDDKVNLDQIQRVMDWAEVTWFEWCDKILAHASHKLRKTSRVVCRLHRYEAFTSVPRNVNWSFVDTLVSTTRHITKVLDERAPNVRKQTEIRVISSTVDVTRFAFKEREPGFNIAYLGYLHHRKNPSLLLQCMHTLTREDDRYHLHIGGYFQQPVWEYYFNHMLDELELRNHVTLHGWIDDVKSWLDDKHYMVLPTIHEGNPYSILEAAASGIKPLIHSFAGSEEIYPIEWTFRSPTEFAQKIQHGTYNSKTYRRFTESRFSLKQTIEEKVIPLLTDLSSQSTTNRTSTQAKLSRQEEVKRIQSLGKFTSGSTHLLGPTTYFCDAPTFLWGYKEIFQDEIYRFKPDRSAPNIIDCGANIGLAVLYWKQQFPDAEIIAFEPDPVAYKVLSQNVQSHGLKRVDTIAKGVWKSQGEVVFCSEGSTAGRLEDVSEIAPSDRPSQAVNVQVVRLRDFLTDKVDLLKIDIEGAEYEVLADCSDLLTNVQNLFVEYHSFPGEDQKLSEILHILSSSNFRYHIKPGFHVNQPFTERRSHVGMDNQINIYAYR